MSQQFDTTTQQQFYAEASLKHGPVRTHMAEGLLDRLTVLSIKPKSILIIGELDTQAHKKLTGNYPYASINYIPHFELLQINNINHESIDLFIANGVLSWTNDLNAIIKSIKYALNPSGVFCFAMLGPETLIELGAAWAAVDDMPHVHNFYDMHDVGDALVEMRFSDPVMDAEIIELQYNDVASLCKDIKSQGLQNCLTTRRQTLTGKSRFNAMKKHYKKSPSGIIATVDIYYGLAFGMKDTGARSMDASGEVSINIDDIIKLK